jgi:hypothetical protein
MKPILKDALTEFSWKSKQPLSDGSSRNVKAQPLESTKESATSEFSKV